MLANVESQITFPLLIHRFVLVRGSRGEHAQVFSLPLGLPLGPALWAFSET